MKTCTKCSLEKNTNEYRFDKNYKDNLFSWCKSCETEYARNYRNKNNDIVKSRIKNWTEKNPDKVKAKRTRFYSKNIQTHIIPESKLCKGCNSTKSSNQFGRCKINKDGLTYKCTDCNNMRARETYRRLKPKILAASRTFALIRHNRTPKWANLEKIKEIYKNRPEGYHVDHIIPLNGKDVCGLHVENNLQYLTAKENLSKGNK